MTMGRMIDANVSVYSSEMLTDKNYDHNWKGSLYLYTLHPLGLFFQKVAIP